MQLLMEVGPTLTYDEVEPQVEARLREYPRLEGRIRILERQALGYGLYIDVNTAIPAAERPDKLQALHAKLRDLPEHMYLSDHEQAIVSTARAYLREYRVGTKSQLYDAKSSHGDTEYEESMLTELVRAIRKVLDARSDYRFSTDEAAIERAELRKRAEQVAEDLRCEKDVIDEALASIERYRPHLSKMLRWRYIEEREIQYICDRLSISERTYARWKEDAICEFATFTGMWGG